MKSTYPKISIRALLSMVLISAILVMMGVSSYTSFIFKRDLEKQLILQEKTHKQLAVAEKTEHLFSEQVQNWKNILLRGQNAEYYYKYLNAFYESERSFLDKLNELESICSNCDDRELMALIAEARETHKSVGKRYREALRIFNESDTDAHLTADEFIKGADRGLNDLMQRIIHHIDESERVRIKALQDELSSTEKKLFTVEIIFALFFLALLMWIVDRKIGRPVEQAVAIARRLRMTRPDTDTDTDTDTDRADLEYLVDALSESESHVKLLINSTAEAIYGRDLKGNCTFVNKACLKLLGYDEVSEVLGKNMHDLIHHTRPDGSEYPEKECRIYEAFQQGHGAHVDDEVFWRKDGSSFDAQYWSHPVKHEGSIVGSVVTFIDISERKMTEKLLRTQDERFRSLLENSPAIIFVKDLDSRYLFINQRWEKVFNVDKDDVIGNTDREIFSKEMAEAVRINDLKVIEANGPLEFEEVVPHEDGLHTYISIKFPLRNASGEIESICGIVTDITERKEAEEKLENEVARRTADLSSIVKKLESEICNREEMEEALRESESILAMAQEVAHVGSWYWDPPTGALSWSDETCRQYGVDPVSIEPSYEIFESLVHPDDLDRVNNDVKLVLEGKKDYDLETRMFRKDGTEWIMQTQGIILRNEDGEPVRLVGTQRDITAQRKAEDEISKYREQLEELVEERTHDLEKSNDQLKIKIREEKKLAEELFLKSEITKNMKEGVGLISATDPDGRLIYTNRAYEQIYRYSPGEMIGMRTIDLNAPSDIPSEEINKSIMKALSEKGGWHGEIENIKKDGTHFWCSLSLSPFKHPSMGLVLIGIANDVTERKKAEEMLKKAKESAEVATKAKSEFLANMSHEIRTPMTSIIGMAELLSETELNNDQAEFIDRLTRSGDSLIRIINDILDLSKVEAGLIELEEINFSIAGEIEKIISIFDVKAGKKRLKLRKQTSPDVPEYLLGDPVRLRQILVNLIGNALKFTESGEVTVSVECGEPSDSVETCSLLISVSDTGIGIPDHKLEAIFEEFSQGDTSTTRTHGGTGLGLAISRKLVELMGGRLDVESKEGEGSTFFFTLAMKIGSHEEGLDEEQTASLAEDKGQALNILLAEDAEDNRLLVKAFLKHTPHTLDMAENGEEAVEKFMANGYDLVLMDMQMPVMDGYTATRVIRSWEERNDKNKTPVIAFTAHALKEEVGKCLEAGCTDHLAKPVKKKELIERIRSYAV